MVHRKTRWKWHECVQTRDRIDNGNDSDDENDDQTKDVSQGSNNEHHQTNATNYSTDEDIFTKQQKLKEEAQVALALGAEMARMQIKFERQEIEKKTSSLYDIIGIKTNGNNPFTNQILEEINIGQLQIIINDLYYQIEANNDELINLLIERDSLSMKHDSILVDIEDLTKRWQERSAIPKQIPANQTTQCVYNVKRSQTIIQKKSIFQNLLQKAMFI